MTRTLVPSTPDRSLTGRIARKEALDIRLRETAHAAREDGREGTYELFMEMAEENYLAIQLLRQEGRDSR